MRRTIPGYQNAGPKLRRLSARARRELLYMQVVPVVAQVRGGVWLGDDPVRASHYATLLGVSDLHAD